MTSPSPTLNELSRQVEQQQQEKIANDIIESQIKIVSASYDKAVAYTNVIVIGGYASFLVLWSFAKPYLTATQARWAALLMLTSVCVFVLFEVYKMVFTATFIHEHLKILDDPAAKTSPKVLLEKFREYDQGVKRNNVTFIKVWRINVLVAVATALIAVAILALSLVGGLFNS